MLEDAVDGQLPAASGAEPRDVGTSLGSRGFYKGSENTSPLLHIGTIFGGFTIRELGV